MALAFAAAALLSPLIIWKSGGDYFSAFRQPLRIWLITVGSLVAYHASIYYAVQKAPPASAALLQGTTPLMIVLGSAVLLGERLRWWHVAGAMAGLTGCIMMLAGDGLAPTSAANPAFYLAIVGASAAIWGLYSLYSRERAHVPTSAMGLFFAASALLSGGAHLGLETWVAPTWAEWTAIAALGAFPMGLALFFWDFGVKRGDIQALGVFSYVEPFLGAVLVAVLGQGSLTWSLFWAGVLIVGGAAIASRSSWDPQAAGKDDRVGLPPASAASPPLTVTVRPRINAAPLAARSRSPTNATAAQSSIDQLQRFIDVASIADELTDICDELIALWDMTSDQSGRYAYELAAAEAGRSKSARSIKSHMRQAA